MPLSQSHPIVLQCFQFAWKIIHVNNSPLFISYLPKSCQRATQCKPCCHKVSVHLKAWSDLPSVNSNELKVFGTYAKSGRILKIFLISPQVTSSTSASASSLWPKYSCLCYCWALRSRGWPPVVLHGNGRCSAHSARERYFLSCHQFKILITDITWIQQTIFGLSLHLLQGGLPVSTNHKDNCWSSEVNKAFRFIVLFPHLYIQGNALDKK